MTGMPTAETTSPSSQPSQMGEPVWELAHWFPRQGAWNVDDYLGLEGNQLVEFDNGSLEFLPMPSVGHLLILGFLYDLLRTWAKTRQHPLPMVAPLPVAIHTNKFREPDLLLPRNHPSPRASQIEAPEMVLEIVSPDKKSHYRDWVAKRTDYAVAGIPEYWIVDPQEEIITVLTLPAGATEYAMHGEFRAEQQATSVLLPEFIVDVTACFAAGNPGETT